ncbi:MAG: hypothetical protein QOJ55_2660 [Solirubrobacteraceae bacterium]|nr:hypothetical protein [Solirubrobacteraceae bacterium]
MAAHGQVRIVEAEPQRALGGERRADAVEQVAPAAALVEALYLVGGALDVAEVRDEHPRPVRAGADHGQPVGAGEPGQVAEIHQVGHQQRVELALGDRGGEALCPFPAHGTSRCSRRARRPSR